MRTLHASPTYLFSAGQKKKKSMSEIISEQIGAENVDSCEASVWDEFGGDGPKIDEYHEGEKHDDLSLTTPGSKRGRKVELPQQRKTEQQKKRRLCLRGPLDNSLSTGEYAATPVDVEAAMDDIFGALEMNDGDVNDDGDGLFTLRMDREGRNTAGDDDNGDATLGVQRKTKNGRRSGRLETEEEYVKWVEAQQALRRRNRPVGAGGFCGEENDILEQLEHLRTAQMELVESGDAQRGDGDEISAKQRQRAQEAMRHYVMVYSQLLRVRIKLQPVVTRAIAFPQYYAFSDYLNAEKKTKLATEGLSKQLHELLSLFYSLATDETTDKNRHLVRLGFSDIGACHRRMMKNVDACIEYWGAKLVQPNNVKLRAFLQPLLAQIKAVLKSKARLCARVQKNRSHITILGHPEHYLALQSDKGKATRALHIAEGDIDEEIYDDTEFMREVVKRSGVAKLEQQLRETQCDLNREVISQKCGFHRMTKGRTISYEPRPKLVGFLLPVPYALSGQHEVLVNSLFQ